MTGIEFTWTSSNMTVGVVNATTGNQALSPGTATVTASAGVTGTAQATVTARTATAIKVS